MWEDCLGVVFPFKGLLKKKKSLCQKICVCFLFYYLLLLDWDDILMVALCVWLLTLDLSNTFFFFFPGFFFFFHWVILSLKRKIKWYYSAKEEGIYCRLYLLGNKTTIRNRWNGDQSLIITKRVQYLGQQNLLLLSYGPKKKKPPCKCVIDRCFWLLSFDVQVIYLWVWLSSSIFLIGELFLF